MNFNEIKPKDYTTKTFGECIKARRIELGRSVRAVAKAVGMSAVYLSDIERCLRVAPTSTNSGKKFMENLISELKIQPDEIRAFYTMAEATCGRYSDISSYLSKKPAARFALRLADEQDIPDAEWQKFIDHIQELSKSE